MDTRSNTKAPRVAPAGAALCVWVALTLACPAPAAASAPAESSADYLRLRLGTHWAITRTPSVRVFSRPGSPPAAAALLELETALHALAARMHLPPRSLLTLREAPLDYFVVSEPSILESFGAGDIEGLAYPANRLIVSSRLPHEHELVHVLLHLALPGRGADNQPFLQEGLASYLGGNGADAELAVLAHADRVFERGPVDLASLWTTAGWQHGRIDAYDRYAVAARFVQFLVESAGDFEQLRQLARLLAGEAEEIAARPWSAIRVQVEGTYGIRWPDLVQEFAAWRAEHPVAGVRESTTPERRPDLTLVDERHHVRVWFAADGWTFAVRTLRGPLDAELYWGETQPRASGLSSAPSVSRRYRLHVDHAGFALSDQRSARVLLRWEWSAASSSASSSPVSTGGPHERVWRWGSELIDPFEGPASMGLWSRPAFEPR